MREIIAAEFMLNLLLVFCFRRSFFLKFSSQLIRDLNLGILERTTKLVRLKTTSQIVMINVFFMLLCTSLAQFKIGPVYIYDIFNPINEISTNIYFDIEIRLIACIMVLIAVLFALTMHYNKTKKTLANTNFVNFCSHCVICQCKKDFVIQMQAFHHISFLFS